PVCCIGLFAAKAVASLTGSHLREGVGGAAFPVGLGVLQVIHPAISQPNATSWLLPFASWRLSGACSSRFRVVWSASHQRRIGSLDTQWCYHIPPCRFHGARSGGCRASAPLRG